MNKIAITLFLILLASIANAQTFTIKGKLQSKKNAVDFASVILQKKDSSFVSGLVSDKNGQFLFDNINSGDYNIMITSIGYEDKKINVKLQDRNIELGTISMDSTTHQLKEIVVNASKVIRTNDKQVALPTKFQIKSSANGIDLLKAMQLSRLHIDVMNNTISSSAQGEVQTRINGAKVNIQQIQVLKPEEIQRVEYHDNPGMQYGQGVACVIDYITKRPVSGGSLSVEAQNSPFDGWGEDMLTGSYNKGKSQFGAYVWRMYRNLHQWRENSETFNYNDGTSFTRIEDGHPDKLIENGIYGNIYYNYKDGNKWYLNTSINLNTYGLKTNTNSTLYPSNNPDDFVNMTDYNKNSTIRPWIDIYFQRNYGKRRTLIFNAVGTYINNDIERNYTEDKKSDLLTDITSKTKGNKYSIIAEAIYSVGVTKNSNLNFGLTSNQAFTSNKYTGSVTATTNMHDGYARTFAEWKQSIGKLNYSLGTYFSYIWILQSTAKLYQTEWYPKMSMSYTFNDNSYIRLSGERSYHLPSLGDISDVEQIIDSLQIRRGNPNLKVNHTWMTDLYYEWRKNKFTLDLSLFYMYQKNPIMEETLLENNKFIRTMLNQKSWQKFTPEIQLAVGPLFNLFTFNIIGGVNYFDSQGLDYHHYYTNWYYIADATIQYKNLTIVIEGKTHGNDFNGETGKWGEGIIMPRAGDGTTNGHGGIMIFNPFSSRKDYHRPTINYNKYAPSNQALHIQESARMVSLTFNWDFSFGRKYEGGNKQLKNEDKDSGTLNSSK